MVETDSACDRSRTGLDDVYHRIFAWDLVTAALCRSVSRSLRDLVAEFLRGVVARSEEGVVNQRTVLQLIPLTDAEAQRLPVRGVQRPSDLALLLQRSPGYRTGHQVSLVHVLPVDAKKESVGTLVRAGGDVSC